MAVPKVWMTRTETEGFDLWLRSAVRTGLYVSDHAGLRSVVPYIASAWLSDDVRRFVLAISALKVSHNKTRFSQYVQ